MSENQAPSPELHPNPNRHWFHRRSIAYLSVLGLFCTLAAITFGDVAEHNAPILGTLCWVFCFNILAYIANNAFENVARMKLSKS